MDEDERRAMREERRRARQARASQENIDTEETDSRRRSSNLQTLEQDNEPAEDVDTEREEREAERRRRQQQLEEEEAEERRRQEELAEKQRLRQEEEARREEQENNKKKKKKGGKRKGLGGLSPEKKRKLKLLIMQKAADEMKEEARRKQQEKENHLNKLVKPLQIDGLSQQQLEAKVKELHSIVANLESEKYDWEMKLLAQEAEIQEFSIKCSDTKGKFVKPVLKKVSKTESKFAKLEKGHHKELTSFRDQLKSTGQSKFALENKEDDHKKPEWAKDSVEAEA